MMRVLEQMTSKGKIKDCNKKTEIKKDCKNRKTGNFEISGSPMLDFYPVLILNTKISYLKI